MHRFSLPLLGVTLLTAGYAASTAHADRPAMSRAPVSASGRQPLLDQDARLDRPVTLRLKKSPLSAIVAALGQQAGVTLEATPGVADEPAIVFVTDQPAKEVMHHLAQLLHYRWTRRGTAEQYRYEIYQDLNSRQEEETLRDQRRTSALRGLQSALSTRFAIARRSPEQLHQEAAAHEKALAPFERLPKEARTFAVLSPLARVAEQAGARAYQLREMADPFRRALLQVAAALPPGQWEALVAGETLHFSTRPRPGTLPLSAVATSALRSARPSLLPPGARVGFASAQEEASFREVERQAAQAWALAEAVVVTVRLGLPNGTGGSQAMLTLTPEARMPDSYAGAPSALPSLVVIGDPSPVRNGGGDVVTEGPPAVDSAWEADPMLGAARSFAVSLAVENRGEAEAGTLNAVLPQIAEAYGINLVADAYRGEPLPLPDLTASTVHPTVGAETESRRLYEVLNLLVAPSARWSKEGDFLHVRRRTWAHDRAAEIPGRVASAWAARLRASGSHSLDTVASLVLALRDEQLERFEAVMIEHGIEIGGLFDDGVMEPDRQRAILRAYGTLLPLQRETLRGGGTVPVVAMPAAARHWLWRALDGLCAGAAGGTRDGFLTLCPAPSATTDEGDATPPAGAIFEEPPRAADGTAPPSSGASARGVLFRWMASGNAGVIVVVTLPRITPKRSR